MGKRASVFLPLLGLSALVSSCSFYGMFGDKYVSNGPYDEIPLSDESEVTAKNLMDNQGKGGMPTKGVVNALVIPIAFSDYAFEEGDLEELEIAMNGDSEETKYWESVRSFYYESSFGKLEINSTIAPVYEVDMTALSYMSRSSSSGRRSLDLMREAVDDYVDNGGDTDYFDSDDDGYIDALYLIYACPTYSSEEGLEAGFPSEFWAFTYWDSFADEQDYAVGNGYIFASIDFLHNGSADGIDAHTYIHETGHLLGLDDYYNYDLLDNNANTSEAYRYYSPLGGYDMMDFNVMDHNAVSKWLLGWNTPYVVTSDLEFPLNIELDSSVLDGEFLILVPEEREYNGTPFDEYIAIELYEPAGLNYMDATEPYNSYGTGYSEPGLKIYHSDMRLYRKSGNIYGEILKEVTAEKLERSPTLGHSIRYVMGASNTPSYSKEPGYRALHLLESDGELTFDKLDNGNIATGSNETLFNASAGHNQFDMESFSEFFENGELLNSGESLGYSVEVTSLGYDSEGNVKASLTIDTAYGKEAEE